MKFIDLFAGIGGFHIALHNLGAECVFASEIDAYARKTYEHNLKHISPDLFKNNQFNDDILKITDSKIQIPDFDILCAGFPCQPFSQAGHKRGFGENLQSRGNMFFKICDIIREKQPKAFFLENVRHLLSHDDGRTFEIIKECLTVQLGYSFHYKTVKASDHGLPQHRPRIFMVGFRREPFRELPQFKFPEPVPLKMTMSDVWEGACNKKIGFTLRVGGRGSGINDRRNWDAYLVDGIERRLAPKEGKRMMGIPDSFEFPVSDVQALKQLGNGVAVNAVQATAANIIQYLEAHYTNEQPQRENLRKVSA